MTYDNDNIFAKILRDELPCHKVYEDENTLAFLDIMPRADGHTLVIPKQPSRNILDLEPQEQVNASDFLQTCLAAFPSCIPYSYAEQQELLPSIL